MIFGPLKDFAHGTVEFEQVLGHISHFLPVCPVVYAGTFHHKKESHLVVQSLDSLHCTARNVSRIAEREHVFVLQHGNRKLYKKSQIEQLANLR